MFKPVENQRGQGLIEYLLIVCLVAIGAMAVLRGLGQTVAANFATITNQLQGKPAKAPTVRVDASSYRKKDMSNFFQGATNAGSTKGK